MKLLLSLMIGVMLIGSLAFGSTLPSKSVPDGLGVNIHFAGDQTHDMDMIRDAGFKFVRMDLTWQSVEKSKGVYDFAPYDQLVDGLASRGIRVLFILDYGNPLYGENGGVNTEAGREAFAQYAAAAAERYKGKGVLWEVWNEPNVTWRPQPGVDAYMQLVKVTVAAIRKADPDAFCIAPAAVGVDLKYLEQTFKQGLLNMVDAVSVHPYRQGIPESVAGDYSKLRALIARYKVDRSNFPIISGEWGYTSVWSGMNDELQGEYLAREFLINLSQSIPLSIWYDWKDDGQDAKNPEYHFGTVTIDYAPKPAYLAMQELSKNLTGMQFVKRLPAHCKFDYLLLFQGDSGSRLAAWTTCQPHEVTLSDGRKLQLTGKPQYVAAP